MPLKLYDRCTVDMTAARQANSFSVNNEKTIIFKYQRLCFQKLILNYVGDMCVPLLYSHCTQSHSLHMLAMPPIGRQWMVRIASDPPKICCLVENTAEDTHITLRFLKWYQQPVHGHCAHPKRHSEQPVACGSSEHWHSGNLSLRLRPHASTQAQSANPPPTAQPAATPTTPAHWRANKHSINGTINSHKLLTLGSSYMPGDSLLRPNQSTWQRHASCLWCLRGWREAHPPAFPPACPLARRPLQQDQHQRRGTSPCPTWLRNAAQSPCSQLTRWRCPAQPLRRVGQRQAHQPEPTDKTQWPRCRHPARFTSTLPQ
jgi:hypothetical protein